MNLKIYNSKSNKAIWTKLSASLVLDIVNQCFNLILTLNLFYTCGLGIVVLHVMVPQPYSFPLDFLHRYGNFTILKFSFKWVKVMQPYTVGGGLPVVGGGGSLMTHSAGSVTTRSIALKYVMASEPYRYT
jgi:hypothetical protein